MEYKIQCAWCHRFKGEDGNYSGEGKIPLDVNASHSLCMDCRLKYFGPFVATISTVAAVFVLLVHVLTPGPTVVVVIAGRGGGNDSTFEDYSRVVKYNYGEESEYIVVNGKTYVIYTPTPVPTPKTALDRLWQSQIERDRTKYVTPTPSYST